MKKNKVYILIYLSMMLPVFLAAAPIDKYYVPPLQQQIPQQQVPQQQVPWQQIPSPRAQIEISEDVYIDFENKARPLSVIERTNLISSFDKKMKTALKNKNLDEARYFQKLIEILDELNKGDT